MGASPSDADTDGDGLSDFVEIMEGLDPFGGLALPTGVIASLSLQGVAKEVVVESVGGMDRIAYVATGSAGLALVDVSLFDAPILLGAVELPGDGRDIGVDAALGIAALASGIAGLHLVDVSDPQNPTLIETVELAANAQRVEVFDGVAYVAVGSSLESVDLLTGEVLQTLSLGGANITNVVREGSMLYTMTSSNALSTVDISNFLMLERDSLTLPNGGGRIFVGNGIAYTAATDAARGVYVTAEVSEPDNITLSSVMPDLDPVAPGVQVTQGSSLPLRVEVTNDVQVKKVELLVDGVVTERELSRRRE